MRFSVEEFKELALKAHADDDWGEFPYSHHLQLVVDKSLELAHCLGVEDLDLIASLAWVHDVYEDHPEYETVLRDMGVFKWVSYLSKQRGEGYFNYIDRVVQSQYAGELCSSSDVAVLVVKTADLLVNFCNDPPRESLRERYIKAFSIVFSEVIKWAGTWNRMEGVQDFVLNLEESGCYELINSLSQKDVGTVLVRDY